MSVPRRPTVELFHPFEQKVRWSGSVFMDDDPTISSGLDDHSDTQVRVYLVSPKTLICDKTYGAAAIEGTLETPDLTVPLDAGELFRCRVRYANSEGWSSWSRNTFERTPRGSVYDAQTVNAEPPAGDTLSIMPEFVLTASRRVALREWIFDTRHVARRMAEDHQRIETTFEWLLGTTDKETLIAFLDARINGAESFSFTSAADEVTGEGRAWMIKRGSKRVEMLSIGAWRITCDVIETATPAGASID